MTTVLAFNVGEAKPLARGEDSAIDKRPVLGTATIRCEGLLGDRQADRRVHGGPHMALHAYPSEHFAFWLEQFGGAHHRLPSPGSFGENLTLEGLAETDVAIGDRFRLGSALIEVSMGRQPCWKLDAHLRRRVVATVLETGKAGWYFRVLEEGVAEAGDTLHLAERRAPEWSVALVTRTILGPEPDRADLEALADLEPLAPVWRERAARLVSAP